MNENIIVLSNYSQNLLKYVHNLEMLLKMQKFNCSIVIKIKQEKINYFPLKQFPLKKSQRLLSVESRTKNILITLINYFETFKNIRKYSRCIRNNSANRNFISVEILSALNIIVL